MTKFAFVYHISSDLAIRGSDADNNNNNNNNNNIIAHNNNNNNNNRISIPPSVVTSEAVAEPTRSRKSAIVG